MHEHQSSFMAIVDLFIAWVCDTFSFHLFPSLSQVVVPKLIAVMKKVRQNKIVEIHDADLIHLNSTINSNVLTSTLITSGSFIQQF